MTSAELLSRLSDCFDNNGELYKPTEAEALLRDYVRAVLAEAERAHDVALSRLVGTVQLLIEKFAEDVRGALAEAAADLLAGMRR